MDTELSDKQKLHGQEQDDDESPYEIGRDINVLVKHCPANGDVLGKAARAGAYMNVYQPWYEVALPSAPGTTLLTTLVEHCTEAIAAVAEHSAEDSRTETETAHQAAAHPHSQSQEGSGVLMPGTGAARAQASAATALVEASKGGGAASGADARMMEEAEAE